MNKSIGKFDAANNYSTLSMLVFPIKNPAGDLTAVLQIVNARTQDHVRPFHPSEIAAIELLCLILGFCLCQPSTTT